MNSRSQKKNTFKLNKIYKGDCIEVMKSWEDNCIDHCIVDPPFNMSKKKGLGWAFSSHVTMQAKWDQFPRKVFIDFCKTWIKEVMRVVKPNGNIFIFGTYHNIYDIGYILNEFDLKILNSIIWFKPNAQPNITCRMLTESTEQLIWACNNPTKKAKNWVFNYEIAKKFNDGKQLRNVWSIPYTPKSEKVYGNHPTQKPLNLLTRLIFIASKPDEIILDCFAGSGTLGVVAQSFNRNWVMIEKEPKYVKIAKKRLKNQKLPIPNNLLQMELFKSG